MKIGHILALSAVSLFSLTLLWSTQKTVDIDLFQHGKTSATPAERDSNRYFYPGEARRGVNIQAPVNVELDGGFSGLEIRGDTSGFKYLRVSTDYGWLNVGLSPIDNTYSKDKPVESRAASLEFMNQHIKLSTITVRIGTRQTGRLDAPRRFTFANCNYLTTLTPMEDRHLILQLHGTDSVHLDLKMQALEVNQTGIRPENSSALFELSGTVEQLEISQMRNTRIAASKLQAREVYIRNALDLKSDLFVSDIVNIVTLDSTSLEQIKIQGRPAHTRISKIKTPAERM